MNEALSTYRDKLCTERDKLRLVWFKAGRGMTKRKLHLHMQAYNKKIKEVEDRMKTEYTDEDIARAREWYAKHHVHVDRLMKSTKSCFPMSGSDISNPEMWKIAGWKWFFATYGR